MILAITEQSTLLETNTVLEHSTRLRNPYVDPMSLIQAELIRRKRPATAAGPPQNSIARLPRPSTVSQWLAKYRVRSLEVPFSQGLTSV